MERKLAHIERISWIKPIKDADKIELYGQKILSFKALNPDFLLKYE